MNNHQTCSYFQQGIIEWTTHLAVEAAVAAPLGALAGEVALLSTLEALGRSVAALALK
jgi:hypothetical protein